LQNSSCFEFIVMSYPYRIARMLPLVLLLCAAAASVSAADRETVKTAVAAGVGGAVGAVVGEEVGGRNGAIVGAAAGAAIGAAVATDSNQVQRAKERVVVVTEPGHTHHRRHCPPGQAKKGRC
jgi:uncharacterized protein YcfJ